MDKSLSLFGKILSERLEQRNWSQADLVRRSGVNKMSISSYCAGTEPKLGAALKIAQAFGMSLSEFMGEDPSHSLLVCLEKISVRIEESERSAPKALVAEPKPPDYKP